MKRFLLVILCSLFPLSVCTQNSSFTKADTYFARGNLSGARDLLLEIAEPTSGYPPETRATALNRLARFYEEMVGSPAEALRFCRQVMLLEIGRDHPEKVTASEIMERIKHDQTTYAALELQLGKLRQKTASVQETKAQIKRLKAVLNDVPDYPYAGQIYYDIGIKHYQLQEFYRAYYQLRRASDYFPGLRFQLPIEFHTATALKNSVKTTILGCAWSIVSTAIILTGGFFLGAKTWRLLQGRHLALLIGTVCGWGTFLYAAAWGLGTFRAPNIPPLFDKPTFSAGLPGEPGSEILMMMGLFGVIAIILIFGLHLAMLHFRFSLTRTYMHAMASLLIFSSVFSIFFYRNCEEVSIFQNNPQQPLTYLNGSYFFPVSTTLQNVLTNIRAYPGLSLDNIDEPEVKAWIRKQYSIIANSERID